MRLGAFRDEEGCNAAREHDEGHGNRHDRTVVSPWKTRNAQRVVEGRRLAGVVAHVTLLLLIVRNRDAAAPVTGGLSITALSAPEQDDAGQGDHEDPDHAVEGDGVPVNQGSDMESPQGTTRRSIHEDLVCGRK